MITISSEKNNTLLNRKELQIDITFSDKTPSKKELQKQLAAQQKVKENLVVIKDIFGVYGDRRAKVRAYIYDNEKVLKDIEPKIKEKKEKKPKPEKPAPKAEEKPKEEPKPEAKPAEAAKEVPKEQPKGEKK